jgi:hypothetical protein
MKNHKLPILYSIFLIIVFSLVQWLPCQAMPPLDLKTQPAAPDYTVPEGWLVKPAAPTAAVDVFFVYPTVLFNDTDWIMDTTKPDMRAAAMESINTQASVFEGQANIYAPMYRQMNIAGLSLSDADAAPLQDIVHNDVWRALTHYLKYENNGRPFFLAGHSQGSMILTDLLLEYWGSTGAENRLVAALLIGWSLTPADLAANSSVHMCERSNQTGCVISYNTMAEGRQSVAPTLKKDALTVNPLSWTMDSAFVPAEKNIGAVFFDKAGTPSTYPHFTSAQIVDGGLIVLPKNVDLVTVKGGNFPEGVYHAFDYTLFFENLKANIAERIDAFVR